MGVRAVMLASGGMSHLPGTERYSTPSVDWDRALLEKLKTGNLRSLLSHNDQMADDNGEGELRTWQILAGALGERVPDVVACEPSWHHVYGVVGFTTETKPPVQSMHYPPVSAERLALYDALYKLRMDEEARVRFIADPAAYADQYDLTSDERAALVDLDEAAVRELGLHAMIGFLARLQVDITRRSQ
jgi:2,3-dihydroxyphenylpropionate 1,2-dioxygenase